jgi:hypothetical protein
LDVLFFDWIVLPVFLRSRYRVSQVPDVSLDTCHVLGPRQTLGNLTNSDSSVLASTTLNVSPSAFFLRFTEHSSNGAESRTFGTTFRSYGPPCGPYRALCTLHLTVTSFGATLNTGGWLGLPGKDFHLARNTKLRLAYVTVGSRIAPPPPHRSRRAVFPHRALHSDTRFRNQTSKHKLNWYVVRSVIRGLRTLYRFITFLNSSQLKLFLWLLRFNHL